VTANRKLVALQTIVVREVLRFSRIWIQTILPPMVTTSLYFIIFGQLIGSRIGDMEGIPYIDYIVPGLILMVVITQSYANVVSSFFSSKFQRHIEELLIAPVPGSLIVLGYVFGGVARGMAVGVAVTLVAAWFSDLRVHDIAVTLSIVFLTSVVFAIGGLINGIFAKTFDDISIIPTFVLTPLTYLGGVFYSVSMLPEFWAKASLFNPVFYMINAFRYGLLGVSDIDLFKSYLIICALIAGMFWFSVHLLRTGYGTRS